MPEKNKLSLQIQIAREYGEREGERVWKTDRERGMASLCRIILLDLKGKIEANKNYWKTSDVEISRLRNKMYFKNFHFEVLRLGSNLLRKWRAEERE